MATESRMLNPAGAAGAGRRAGLHSLDLVATTQPAVTAGQKMKALGHTQTQDPTSQKTKLPPFG